MVEGVESLEHDMGALSWLDAETLERVPIALFDRLVRCSTHGHSFVRLWYVKLIAEREVRQIIVQCGVQISFVPTSVSLCYWCLGRYCCTHVMVNLQV